MNETITLADGREVTWDEYCALDEKEQELALKKHDEVAVDLDTSGSVGRRLLLPRLQAAAESGKIREEELLAFIKVVHDIFFPPAPVPKEDAELIANRVTKKYGGAFVQQSKRVLTPLGEFPSQAAAARAYNVEGARVRAWIKKGNKGFSLIKDGQ
jgi:hypothetical protein